MSSPTVKSSNQNDDRTRDDSKPGPGTGSNQKPRQGQSFTAFHLLIRTLICEVGAETGCLFDKPCSSILAHNPQILF